MNKKGFALSATIYSLFIITVIIIFYILYILTSNRTTVATITNAVESEVNFEPMGKEIQKSFEYGFIGNYQEFKAPLTGTYKFELWGANSKGNGTNATPAYVKAELDLTAGEILYVYVGEEPNDDYTSYNGGGRMHTDYQSFGAGGATDIRFKKGPWYENIDSRIIVAGGAGSSATINPEDPIYDKVVDAAGTATENDGAFRYGYGGSANIINGDCTETTNTSQPLYYSRNADSFQNSATVNTGIKLFGENGKSRYIATRVYEIDNDMYGFYDIRFSSGAGGGGYTGGKSKTILICGDCRTNWTGGGGGSSFVSTKNWCPALLDSLAVKKTETEYYDFKNVEMKITNIPNAYGEGTNNYHLGHGMVKINYCEGGVC